MKRADPGYPDYAQKFLDQDGTILTVTGFHDRPAVVFMRPDKTQVVYGEDSQCLNALRPYEEPKPAPNVTNHTESLLDGICSKDLFINISTLGEPGRREISIKGPEDVTWAIFKAIAHVRRHGAATMSSDERDQPVPLRTIRHAIGDISMEETIYTNDWSDEELSATWRSVCAGSATLSPAETMLVFARHILRGQKAS